MHGFSSRIESGIKIGKYPELAVLLLGGVWGKKNGAAKNHPG
jgi:hypothetical protein